MAILPATGDSEAAFEATHEEGSHSLEANCTDVFNGGTIHVEEDVCFDLQFDKDLHENIFKINTTGHEYIALFAEHFLTEFGSEADHLFDDHGDEIKPDHTEPEEGSTHLDKPWGEAIGASIIVNLVTFSGIVFLIPAIRNWNQKNSKMFESVCQSFAAGAIISTAVFFVLIEGVHYIESHGYGGGEVGATWRWGTSVLAGLISPTFMSTLLQRFAGRFLSGSGKVEPADGKDSTSDDATLAATLRARFGVVVGDFTHNFVDGIVIATAFQGCSTSMAWSIVAATVGHEIAQELGDYLVLTGPGQLSAIKALAWNFISGLSVMIGAICVLSEDLNNGTIGVLLAFGGGVYIAIGATECLPRAAEAANTAKLRIMSLAAFFTGAIAIGLVLLDHEHCEGSESEGNGHGHGGH